MAALEELSNQAEGKAGAKKRSLDKRFRYVLRRYPIGLLGVVVVSIVVLVAISANVLAPFDPVRQIAERLSPPGGAYVLGTDEFGRDVFSRVIFGARISLYVGIISVLCIALPIGGTVGVLSGFYGGWFDNLVMRVVDMTFAIPTLVLALTIVGILGPNLQNAMIAVGIVYSPTFARISRGPTLSVKGLDYVSAAHMLGASNRRIIWRHILPNIAAPLIVQTTLALSTAILAEASLSFLGLGTQPPTPSWGTMLGTGRQYMELAPWLAIFPGVAIMIAVLGFNLAGDGLRDYLDPRLKEA